MMKRRRVPVVIVKRCPVTIKKPPTTLLSPLSPSDDDSNSGGVVGDSGAQKEGVTKTAVNNGATGIKNTKTERGKRRKVGK